MGNKPIRILHVVTKMDRAGLETMLMNYYRQIDRTQVQFDFLTHRSEEGEYDSEIKELGGKIYHLPPFRISNVGTYPKCARAFFREHPEYKVVHSHIDALSGFTLYFAKKSGVSVRIAHSHNTAFDLDAKYIIRLVARMMLNKYANYFYACSRMAADFMFTKNNCKNVYILNNAIKPDLFERNDQARNHLRRELDIENNFVIGHIGRFMPQKNQEYLISIFESVSKLNGKAVLLLIGKGPDEQIIRKLVTQKNLDDKVLFLGVRSDIPDLMQAMDLFLLPSRYEGLPVVAIEAQAAGLPVVLADSITTEADVTGKTTFISLHQPPEHWAEQILSMGCQRMDNKQAIIKSGYSIYVEAKSLQQRYLELYNR